MKKFIFNIVKFALVLFALLLIKKHLTPYYSGDRVIRAKLHQFRQSSGSYNTVVFGSSRLYRQLNTVLFDSLTNQFDISSYNFAYAGTYNPESYFLFENFLESDDSENVKYVFLELQALNNYSRGNQQTTKGSYWNNSKFLKFSLNYIKNSDETEELKEGLYKSYLESYLYSFFDLSFIKNLSLPLKTKGLGEQGYYSLEEDMAQRQEHNPLSNRWEKFHSDTTVISQRIEASNLIFDDSSYNSYNKCHFAYLNQLILKSKLKGIHLIYIIPPRLSKKHYRELIPVAKKLLVENLIEMYSYTEHKELYSIKSSFDIGHLNDRGSDIFTNKIAQSFSNQIQKPVRK